MVKKKNFKLGEVLIKRGIISLEQLDAAFIEQKSSGEYLGQILIRLGFLEEHQLLEALSDQLGVPYVKDLKSISISKEVIQKIPAKLATHYHFIPLSLEDGAVTICVSNPLDFRVFDEIRALVGFEVEVVMSDKDSIEEAIRAHYGVGASVIDRMSPMDEKVPKAPKTIVMEDIEAESDDASVIELVNQLLSDAQNSGATDLHFEPFKDGFEVRYRVDGILQPAKIPIKIKQFQSSIISRIKIMAGLDIAEKRLPQDGRILAKTKAGELDLRVSIIPAPHGEAVMIRMLTPTMLVDLKKLGFSDRDQQLVEESIKKPNGIILVTGPTGSGKTTTLYACLKKLNTQERKIITIEDPIEYELKGVLQMQVQPKIDLTFASCLRHALRHDPDVMMVGEIRDVETAQIASRSALTGHLVLSTLHTRDAPGAVTRLIDMGVEPYLVASSVETVIAQRLVRKVCQHCRQELPKEKLGILDPLPEAYRELKFFEGSGCSKCRNTGYYGRMSIHEVMNVDDEVRQLIVKQVPASTIRQLVLKKDMKTLWEDGIEKAVQGQTTISEVFRVAPQEHRLSE